VDIEAVAAHYAEDATMRSPLALRLTGQSTVLGHRAIHEYWTKAYGHVSEPKLKLESASWDARLQRLTVWWQAGLPSGKTRACELMDFDSKGLIQRSEAYYGA
jgi:hypothetical protein